MTLQQLRDLVAVVSHGGFRAAARSLEVSQAGLTKSLARLEDQHGVSLIEREARGVKLTPAGQQFFRHAQALLREADRAEDWLRTTRGQTATDVSLGVSIEPSLRFIPAVLANFRRFQPDVTLYLTQSVASELLAGVRENRLEFAITRMPATFDAAGLDVDPLCDSESVIVGRKGHPCAGSSSFAALVDQEWVVLGDRGSVRPDDESIRAVFNDHRLGPPRVAAITDSLFGALSILMESDCLVRLPRAVLQHPIVGKLLVAIPVREPLRRGSIALVQKSSHRLSSEGHVLASMLSSFARISYAVDRGKADPP